MDTCINKRNVNKGRDNNTKKRCTYKEYNVY